MKIPKEFTRYKKPMINYIESKYCIDKYKIVFDESSNIINIMFDYNFEIFFNLKTKNLIIHFIYSNERWDITNEFEEFIRLEKIKSLL